MQNETDLSHDHWLDYPKYLDASFKALTQRFTSEIIIINFESSQNDCNKKILEFEQVINVLFDLFKHQHSQLSD